jgi:hypothetical protein
MKKRVLRIAKPDDERVRITLDGQDVVSVNHDEHGWDGMEIAEKTAVRLAELAGWKVEQ